MSSPYRSSPFSDPESAAATSVLPDVPEDAQTGSEKTADPPPHPRAVHPQTDRTITVRTASFGAFAKARKRIRTHKTAGIPAVLLSLCFRQRREQNDPRKAYAISRPTSSVTFPIKGKAFGCVAISLTFVDKKPCTVLPTKRITGLATIPPSA